MVGRAGRFLILPLDICASFIPVGVSPDNCGDHWRAADRIRPGHPLAVPDSGEHDARLISKYSTPLADTGGTRPVTL